MLAALGGCMVPPEFFPDTLRRDRARHAARWAYEALAEIQRHDGTLVDVLPELGVLPVWPPRCSRWVPGSCGGASAAPCNQRAVPGQLKPAA